MDGPAADVVRISFLPEEVALLAQQHAGKLAPARVESLRQLACGLMDKVGSRLGFPRRTIATAQVLYHRFHLFFPVKDFNFQDVSIAALLVACKLEDTLKKLRELQIAAHQVKAAQDGTSTFSEPDPHILEQERSQLIAVERLILETISFNFNLRSSAAYPFRESYSTASQNQDVFAYVLKIGQHLGASKDYIKRAFRLAVDAHRTVLPLSYPPHSIATACLYLTGFLTVSEMEGDNLYFPTGWASELYCEMGDIEEICYGVLDLLLSLSATANSTARTSPSETILPFQSPRDSSTFLAADGDVISAELTQIKILLRSEAARRDNDEGDRANRRPRFVSQSSTAPPIDESQDSPKMAEDGYLGRDDVTIRFLWDAPQTEMPNGK